MNDGWDYNIFQDCILGLNDTIGHHSMFQGARYETEAAGFKCGSDLCLSTEFWCSGKVEKFFQFGLHR
jgi:hypothetical protein